MPSTHIAGLSEYHAPVIEKVQLSSSPGDGDVYEHDNAKDGPGKKWRLTKQALMKLSVCGGVIWSAEGCRRVDDGRDRNYCCYQAIGGIKKADGAPVFFKAQYDLDFEVVEQELKELYEKKAKTLKKGFGKDERPATDKEKVDYVEYCVNRDMLQKRKHKVKLCEAGAMNRVIREIFGLKQAYTAEELTKPFVMARIVFRPDYNDKDVKKALLAAHIQAMTGVYGGPVMEAAVKESEPIDVTELSKDNPPEDQPPGETQRDYQLTPEQRRESQITDFKNADAEGQAVTLKELAKKVGYDLQGWLTKVNAASMTQIRPEKRLEMFTHLLVLFEKQSGQQINDNEPF
jgi:hypothetical protein